MNNSQCVVERLPGSINAERPQQSPILNYAVMGLLSLDFAQLYRASFRRQ
ncbi:MAG: hypothetical protein ACR2OV_15330 [Hyphomicrobiaceae bacterium]